MQTINAANLKNFVLEHYPLLENKFNYRLRRPKYITFRTDINKIGRTLAVRSHLYLQLNNRYNLPSRTCLFNNVEGAKKILYDFTHDVVLGKEKDSAIKNELCRMVVSLNEDKLKDVIEERKQIIKELCGTEYAMYNNSNTMAFGKVLDRVTATGLTYTTFINKMNLYYTQFTNGDFVRISSNNIESIISKYQELFILNESQLEKIRQLITEMAEYNDKK